MRQQDSFDRPPGPFGGMWSMWYLDPIRIITRELKGFRKIRHKAFAELLTPGDTAPPVKLKTTEGVEVDSPPARGRYELSPQTARRPL